MPPLALTRQESLRECHCLEFLRKIAQLSNDLVRQHGIRRSLAAVSYTHLDVYKRQLTKRIEEIRTESQQKSHENDPYWLFCLTPEIDELVRQLHASRKMVDKYNQLSAQQRISSDETTCLQDEKNSKNGYEIRLRDKLTEAMERDVYKRQQSTRRIQSSS